MLLFLLLLCGCTQNGQENSESRFLLNTVAQITADCSDQTLNGAFALCEELEKTLSRTVENSDVSRLNAAEGFVPVSAHTLRVVDRALYYAELSGGRFDITICPVSMLWDFQNKVVPNRDEIAAALQNVDYHSISVREDAIALNGKKIDLGGIAKGYVADRVIDYFKENNVEKALVNLGGSISVIGEYTVGIKTPFKNTVLLAVPLCDGCAVTSGIDQRYIKQDGAFYHHILDPATGVGVENELASVTVLGSNLCAMDCDALSTVCMLLGTEEGLSLINSTRETEAVFISREGEVTLSAGLYRENDQIRFK